LSELSEVDRLAMTKSDIAGQQAKTIPSKTSHALPAPDGFGFAPVMVSWTIRNGAHQVAKVQWGDTIKPENSIASDAQKDAPVSGG
jgi:hypothetical protein